MKISKIAVLVAGMSASYLPFLGAQAPAAISQGSPRKAVDALVFRFEREFVSVAKTMPADKYDFSPASLALPGANFVKVRSFADQVKHVTQANYAIAALIAGAPEAVDVAAIGKLKTKDEILAALAASFLAVHQSIATITPANQNDVVDDNGVAPDQTRESEAAWVAVHGYDHYGQLVEYLRLNGLTPKP